MPPISAEVVLLCIWLATDTDITENKLATNAAAINALAARLNANATSLNHIHKRVVDLTNSLNQLKSAADALGKLAAQLPKPSAASPSGGAKKSGRLGIQL